MKRILLDSLFWTGPALRFCLWGLCVLSIVFMFRSSSDPTGDQIVFDISVGIIVSLFVYVLVVWLPEQGKRARVRRNLRGHYDAFKEECIWIYLSALKGQHGVPPDNLKDPLQFREFFHGPSSIEGQERWHAVLNGLEEYHFKRLAIEFQILMTEVQFTLASIDVDNQEAFAFLKRLLHTLHRMTYVNESYDGVKDLSQVLWSIHTGWSFAEGYREKDPIAKMVESI